MQLDGSFGRQLKQREESLFQTCHGLVGRIKTHDVVGLAFKGFQELNQSIPLAIRVVVSMSVFINFKYDKVFLQAPDKVGSSLMIGAGYLLIAKRPHAKAFVL